MSVSRRDIGWSCILLSICAGFSTVHAAGGGLVEGVVRTTAGTGAAGVPVAIEGSPFRTVTDADGVFALANVPDGRYTLVVAPGTAAETRQPLTVDRGASPTETIRLSTAAATSAQTSAPAGEEITVTAPRRLATARTEQKTALNLIDIQPAEEIIKYPDFNAAEALGRVPGVSLTEDTGEGRFVTIRGLDSNLNGATLGGVVLLNTQPGGTYFGSGGRAVEFDTVPIGIIDRIVVTKTNAPDHEAEGLGGTVELTPRTATTINRPFVEGIFGGGYEPLRDSYSLWRGEITAGARFGLDGSALVTAGSEGVPADGPNPRPFSIVATASRNDDRRAIDDLEEAYADQQPALPDKQFDALELRRYQYHRRRFGWGGDVEFQPNSDNDFYFRYTEGGYRESVYRQRLLYQNLEFDADGNNLAPSQYVVPGQPNAFLAPFATLDTTLRDEQEDHINKVIAWGGKNRFGRFTLDYQGAYAQATYQKAFDRNSDFANGNNVVLLYNNITNANVPGIQILNGVNPNDPSQYTIASYQNSQGFDRDREWSGQANLAIDLDALTEGDQVKIGGKARLRDKLHTTTTESYNTRSSIPLTAVLGAGPFTYYDNNYTVGYSISSDLIRQYVANNPLLFTERTARDRLRDAGAFFNDTENVYAGYAQYTGQFGDLGILAGVRVENTDATYRGNLISGSSIAPNAQKSNYTDVFPTFQARYNFLPELQARLTYSTAIGRPGFFQVTSATNIDTGAGTVVTGNPNLKPTTSDNFDFSLEYYLPNNGVASFGAFDKEFDNYIVQRTVSGTYPDIIGIARISTFENASSAQAYGLEANYDQKFTFLPAPLDGFGILGNATWVYSRVELRPGETHLLPGTSRLTYNAALYYEKDGFQLRFAAQYVSRTLFVIGGSPATDTIQDARLTFDVTSSYAVTDHLTLYFNGRNLTDEPLRFYEGQPQRPIQREFYDVTLETGLRFRF